MSDAALALLEGLKAQLTADAAVAVAFAGQIHDAPARAQRFPSLVIEDVATTDTSGAEAPLLEHKVTLRLLSRAGGKREALGLAATVTAALATPPVLSGHVAVLLTVESSETRLLRDRLTSETTIRLKVLTEPA